MLRIHAIHSRKLFQDNSVHRSLPIQCRPKLQSILQWQKGKECLWIYLEVIQTLIRIVMW